MSRRHKHARRTDWPRELTLTDLVFQEVIVVVFDGGILILR
jgi:hypothetical protein